MHVPLPTRLRERFTARLAPVLPLLLLLCASTRGAVIYVNRNAGGTHDGKGWSTAFTSLQPAFDIAQPGDEVWVATSAPAAPAYAEQAWLPTGVRAYGGFAGNETARGERDRLAHPTVLSGKNLAAAISSSSQGVGLDGFTLRDGPIGAAVTGGTTTVTNCVFSGFTDEALIVQRGAVTILNCTISACDAALLVRFDGSATAMNCTISGNNFGAFASSGTVALTNCIVAYNASGVFRDPTYSSTQVTLTYCDVFGNKSEDFGNIPDPTGTNGNLHIDPKLTNPYHSIHIQPDSPCINAGEDSAVQVGWTDVDGQPRIQAGRVDIGSDESDGTRWTVPSRVWYVRPEGRDANDGSSWEKARKTVAAGLALAQGSDEVWVAAGLYQENVSIPVGVVAYGGFAGGETTRAERDWAKNVTVLAGYVNHVWVVTLKYVGGGVDGFAVQSGRDGCNVPTGYATISNCSFSGNENGVNARFGSIEMTRCTLTGNNTGVLRMDLGLLRMSDCVVSGNGTGISAWYGETRVTSSTISGNGYGAYFGQDGTGSLTNCTITANLIGVKTYAFTVAVTNCIVAGNETGIQSVFGSAHVTLSHNDVYGNKSANYLNVADPTGTGGNISEDPWLSNFYHDVHLQPASPCIDAGDDSVVQAGATDIDGQPRIIGSHVDIGSDESDGSTWNVPTRVWYVSTQGNDANDGLSWPAAKRTIGSALAAAQGPDEVWAAEGTYTEIVTVPTGVALYGGFAGGETARAQRDWNAHLTAISGAASSNTVVKANYVDSTLDGITVRDGFATGIWIGGTALVSNCAVLGCRAGLSVGSGARAVIGDCVLQNNRYGVNNAGGMITIAASDFATNEFSGVYIEGGTVTVDRSAFTGNGAGVFLYSQGTANVSNCLLAGNYAGVAIQQLDRASVKLANCTVSANIHGVDLGGGQASITNTIVAFNEVGVLRTSATIPIGLASSDVFGNKTSNVSGIEDPTGTNGNISAEPAFADAAGGDYRLKAGSPCIDAGDDAVVTPGETDLAGKPRKIGSHVDMGAFEYGSVYFTFSDAANALRFASGLSAASPPDLQLLNVDPGSGRLDLRDAVRIARKAAGLEANP